MKKKVLFTSLSLMVASVCVCGSFSAPLITEAYARSTPLDEEEDSKDAIKGKVTICAIFDENHKYPVTVDLCPTFDGGVHHYSTLTPENPTASDKIAVGSYRLFHIWQKRIKTMEMPGLKCSPKEQMLRLQNLQKV